MTEAPSSEKKPNGAHKPTTPVFRPGSAAAGLKPAEIKPLLTSEQTRSEPVAQGLDLTDRPKCRAKISVRIRDNQGENPGLGAVRA